MWSRWRRWEASIPPGSGGRPSTRSPRRVKPPDRLTTPQRIATATGGRPLKFCMITTFFGPHSFGGDAAYVDRLCQALCRRGHEVHVFYCVDAFNAVRGDHPLRSYEPTPGLHLHPLESGRGTLSPLATQATGLPLFKSAALREVLDADDLDVVHFHNISLVGGPGVLGLGANRRAVRIMTAHEHWLICPMHLLWKYDRKPCDGASCVRCSIAGRRPPQVWRYTGAIERGAPASRRPALPQRPRAGGARPPGRSARGRRWCICPTSCPTSGREGSRTRSPSRATALTLRRRVAWSR